MQKVLPFQQWVTLSILYFKKRNRQEVHSSHYTVLVAVLPENYILEDEGDEVFCHDRFYTGNFCRCKWRSDGGLEKRQQSLGINLQDFNIEFGYINYGSKTLVFNRKCSRGSDNLGTEINEYSVNQFSIIKRCCLSQQNVFHLVWEQPERKRRIFSH